MLVFVTPLYYYGMSAQLKTLVDRFCAINSCITRKHMKSALLCAAWNADSWTFEALEAHYRTLVRYLELEDVGTVLGRGCGTPGHDKARSPLPRPGPRAGPEPGPPAMSAARRAAVKLCSQDGQTHGIPHPPRDRGSGSVSSAWAPAPFSTPRSRRRPPR